MACLTMFLIRAWSLVHFVKLTTLCFCRILRQYRAGCHCRVVSHASLRVGGYCAFLLYSSEDRQPKILSRTSCNVSSYDAAVESHPGLCPSEVQSVQCGMRVPSIPYKWSNLLTVAKAAVALLSFRLNVFGGGRKEFAVVVVPLFSVSIATAKKELPLLRCHQINLAWVTGALCTSMYLDDAFLFNACLWISEDGDRSNLLDFLFWLVMHGQTRDTNLFRLLYMHVHSHKDE